MPLFCLSKKKFAIAGIKFKMPKPKYNFRHPDNVETFYNYGREKNWIESALHEKDNVEWVYAKKVRFWDHECEENFYDKTKSNKEKCGKALQTKWPGRSNNSSSILQNLYLWSILNILLFVKMIMNNEIIR